MWSKPSYRDKRAVSCFTSRVAVKLLTSDVGNSVTVIMPIDAYQTVHFLARWIEQ